MKNILNYANGVNANEEVIYWLEHNFYNYQKKNKVELSTIEHIVDFLISDKAPKRLKKMSFEEAKKLTDKWNKALQKKGKEIKETKKDIEIILDFKDGFKIVKLISKKAYEREGYLMGHCVASYYDKADEIYSLRDKNNKPHCTMSKNSQQIKGKGKGEIHPKYIDYVIKFLEYLKIKVRESEMKNLGYIVPKFYKYCKNKLYRGKYLRNNEKIEYKKGYVVLKSINEIKN